VVRTKPFAKSKASPIITLGGGGGQIRFKGGGKLVLFTKKVKRKNPL